MIGHILKKDLKLFWPLIAGLVLLQVIHAVMGYSLPVFSDDRYQDQAYNNFGVICTYAAQLVIVLLVQQDALVGSRQDWLIRPIAHRDMLLAKLALLLLAVRLPVFVCDFVVAQHHGASVSDGLAAAVYHGFEGLVGTDLITFAVAAVTENLLQAIICVLLIAIVNGFGLVWLRPLIPHHASPIWDSANPGWVNGLVREGITLLAVAAVLAVQFFRRKTFIARALLTAALLLMVGVTLLPWNTAFAVQKFFYNDNAAGSAVALGYGGPQRFVQKMPDHIRNPFVYLPLHVANVPAHAILHMANFEIEVLDSNNKPIFHADPTTTISLLERPGQELPMGIMMSGVQNPTDRPLTVDTFQAIQVPRGFYQRWRDRPIHFKVRYSLALLRQSSVVKAGALGAHLDIPGYGRCASSGVSFDNQFTLWCFGEADTPSCVSVTLESAAGVRDPQEVNCMPSYAPGWRKLSAPLAPSHQVAQYAIRDFGPTAKLFPLTLENAPQAQLVLTAYKPADYFFDRDFQTPNLRLADLVAQVAPERAAQN